MFGKIFFSYFLVLAIWSASTNASDKLIHCDDVEPFSVEENGQTYQYNSNLIGFKFNPNNVAIIQYKDTNQVGVFVKDTIVTFQAMSGVTKSYFETHIVGVAKGIPLYGENSPDKYINSCHVVTDLKKSNQFETNGLPKKMVKAILEKASECMTKTLCKAIGTIGNEEYNRAKDILA